jgi:prophage DNA circulation protein
MLTDQDIKLMQEVFVTKEDLQFLADTLVTKEEFRTVQTSIDGLAKMVTEFKDEHIVLRQRVETLEDAVFKGY